MLVTKRPSKLKIVTIVSILLLLIVSGVVVAYYFSNQSTKIISGIVTEIKAEGNIIAASPSVDSKNFSTLQAQNSEYISYESQPIEVEQVANAAIIQWDQQGEEGATVEVRTFNGSSWTPWVEPENDNHGKDDIQTTKASTLVLAQTIKKLQFRYTLQGSPAQPSATINVESSTVQTIDSSRGPDPTSTSVFDKLGRLFSPTATARAEGPRIVTRAEWGSPEPDSSSWTPEYERLAQAVVHHTVTTESPNAAATIRAIWHYHAVTLGWGDIGYNYIVDSAGNIFQGRYFDKKYAREHNVDVVAGHVYGHNRGTTGIAALGDFNDHDVTAVQKDSISNIIGFKLSPYDIPPNGSGGFGAAVAGHRDLYPTACPGDTLYSQLPYIRDRATQFYIPYNAQDKLDYSYHSQMLQKDGQVIDSNTVLQPFDDVKLTIRLKNNGLEPWRNDTWYKTVLGTSNSIDRTSIFYDRSTWISKNRTKSFSKKYNPQTGGETTTNIIQPGEIAVFTIKLSIPDILSSGEFSAKQYKEYFQPVQDGRIWFPRNIGLHQPVNVEKHSYSWQYVSQNLYTNSTMTTKAPSTLTPNTRYYAELAIKNTGNATWHQQTFRLGTAHTLNRSSSVQDVTWLSSNRPAALTQEKVPPGDTGTIKFWIKTPGTPMDKKEYFRPVVDGVTWLQDAGLYWTINSSSP